MKNLKKLASVALALVMTLALAVPAFAAENEDDPAPSTDSATITIKNSIEGANYDIYKILDMTVSGKNAAYTIAEGWNAFFTTGAGKDYLSDAQGKVVANGEEGDMSSVIVGTATKYLTVSDENVVDFAAAALDYAVKTAGLAKTTVKGNGEEAKAENLPYGYYLTYLRGATDTTQPASEASLCSLTNVTNAVTLKIKATLPTIEKTANTNVAGVGEDVEFTVTGKVPDTTNFTNYTYKVSDRMSDGLTFNKDVTVKINGTEITVTPDYDATDNGFELTLDKATLGTNVGAAIEVKYSATVNSKAIETDYENNTAKLTYSNDPSDPSGNGTGETNPVVVKIFTTSIDVDKYALNAENPEDHSSKLSGAEFALYKNGTKKVTNDEGEETDVSVKLYYVKDNEGNVSWTENAEDRTTYISQEGTGNLSAKFDGLGNGTYYLEEVNAPAGYNKMAAPKEVVINVQPEILENTEGAELVSSITDADGNVTEKYIVKANLNRVEEVMNSTGAELPETGGIGTTIFYTMGGLLVAGAGILLVTKKRMGA